MGHERTKTRRRSRPNLANESALPASLRYTGPFVGRRAAVDALERALTTQESRLITVVGPAGSGKTRLAVEVLQRVAPAFDGHVHFIEMFALRQGDFAGHIARAMDLRVDSIASLARALDALGPGLIVVDRADANLDEIASSLRALLDATPTARFLITTRATLSLRDEHVIEMESLHTPRTADELNASEAGRLFFARLDERATASIDSTEDRERIVRLLSRLGHLPLVVELLAGQVAQFGTRALIDRLEHSLDWLATDSRDAPHRSLRFALDESFARVPDADRKLLLGCTLFETRFDASDAEAVGETSDVLLALKRLRFGSWLIAASEGFEFLPPVREYLRGALERTLAAREIESLRERYAARVCARTAASDTLDDGARQELAAALRICAVTPGLRRAAQGALRRAFGSFAAAGAQRAYAEMAQPFATRRDDEPDSEDSSWVRLGLARALRDIGRFDEARELLDDVRTRATNDGHAPLGAASVSAIASLYFKTGQYRQVEAHHAGAVPSDRPEEIEAFATAAAIRGDRDESIRLYVHAIASLADDAPAVDRAMLHACFARLLAELGRHERATEEVDRAVAACVRPPRAITASLTTTRALIAHDRNRWDDAIALYDEAIALYASPASPIASYLAFVRALATLQAGRIDEARAAFRAARRLENAAMAQIKPLVALGDWVVEGIAPPAIAITDDVVRSTYRLFALLADRERGIDTSEAMHAAQLAHEPLARWSVVSRASLRLTHGELSMQRVSEIALLADERGRWFAPPGGRVVSLARRPLLQRALRALLAARIERPGASMTIEDIAAVMWPAERMSAQSRKNRVYVAISSLRAMGLGTILDGKSAGYRLDPAVACEVR